jgi:glycosyltransferase involved in cell wall biosynthesis
MPPAISVLLPAHNEEQRIERAIRSVLDGDFQDVEVIVALDRCSDRTREVVESIADPRVRWVDNNGDPGIGGALNAAAIAGRADLVARLDADDVQEPDRLTRQVAYLRQHALDVCAGWARLVDEAGEKAEVQKTPSGSDEIRRAFKRSNIIVHSSVLMKRESLLAVGGYRRTRWEDYDLWVRLSRGGATFGCLPAVVVSRELRRGGYGATNGRSLMGRVEVLAYRVRAARAIGELAPW